MKRILQTFIFFSLTLNIVVAGEKVSQPLLQTGKVWNYDYTYVDIDFQRKHGNATYWTESDTIIDGRRLFWMCFSKSEEEGQVFRQLWYEEDGKVYTCNDRGRIANLVYDFTLSAGDDAPVHTASVYFLDGLKVVSADSILVRGILRKRLVLAIPEWETGSKKNIVWVEGIGGAKALDEPVERLVGDGREYTQLSCYLDDQCIFEKEDFEMPSYYPMLVDGRAWNVVSIHPAEPPESDSTPGYYKDIKGRWGVGWPSTLLLKGDTIMGGKTYKKLFLDGSFICGLREEGGCIYECYLDYVPETLTFDINFLTGDVFKDEVNDHSQMEVRQVRTFSFSGINRRCLDMWVYKEDLEIIDGLVDYWIEGIGCMFGPPSFPFWWEASSGSLLLSCYDGDKCIFSVEDLNLITNIQSATTKCLSNNHQGIHDLQGRQLNGIPQKGVYIQNGRKMVK